MQKDWGENDQEGKRTGSRREWEMPPVVRSDTCAGGRRKERWVLQQSSKNVLGKQVVSPLAKVTC